jgi:hypothetical protein
MQNNRVSTSIITALKKIHVFYLKKLKKKKIKRNRLYTNE